MVRGLVCGLLGVLCLPFLGKIVSSSSIAASERSISVIKNSSVTSASVSSELSPNLPESVSERFNAIAKAVQEPNPHKLLTTIFPQPELEALLNYSSQPQVTQQLSQDQTQLSQTREIKTDFPEKALPTTNATSQQLPKFDRDLLFPKTLDQSNLDLAHPAPETERVASVFGWRVRPFSRRWQMHKGIDYGAPLGSSVTAAEDGIVTKVVSGCLDFRQRWCGSQYGNWVQIDHGNGVVTTYAHLLNGSIAVQEGTRVWQNQEIARVGSSGWSTGAHLDFRVEIAGQYKNPALYVKSN